jgi:ABC-type phosphate transport system substrate-binding protein
LLRAEHPIDFAISDAPLTDAEVASLKSPIVHLPITLTALQFVYNLPDDQIRSVCSPPRCLIMSPHSALCSPYTDTQVARTHSGPLNLTADIVARIYTRQITNWNDPTILQSNPHLRYAGPIIVLFSSLSLSLPLPRRIRVVRPSVPLSDACNAM